RELNKSLQRHGFRSGEIHGDMDQSNRLKELDRFKKGEINILVASDVAARGLDVKGVSHVFNFDTPWHPDDYVHRIGRTGRAGAKGRAFTFVAEEDAEAIANVEKLTGAKVPVFGKKDVRVDLVENTPKPQETAEPEEQPKRSRKKREDDDFAPRTKPERAPKAKREPRKRRNEDEAPVAAGEWNGPRPGFLDISAT
ncbi:MAG TPA: DEAD/DEAH box helicase, partial [Erythrobacter sp.]|nr:DEAD/DEAH box helicase [Erythrobacter sp.]